MSCEAYVKQLADQSWERYYEIEILWESCPTKVSRISGKLQKEGKFDSKELMKLHIQLLEHQINFYSALSRCIRAAYSGSRATEETCHSVSKALIPLLETLIKLFECLRPVAEVLRRYEGKCDVEDLKPLTDPLAIKMERGDRVIKDGLTSGMKKALEQFKKAVGDCGGKFSVTSAYRPREYQAHLREVWTKYYLLKGDNCPECQSLKKKIEGEFNEHNLKFKPAGESKHSTGMAADISITLPGDCKKTIDELAKESGLYRPIPKKDPVHFQVRRPGK